ncbi:hypothetical protein DXG03_007615 [Asterophora parasitica]|uniref:Zn(2)-C6 fungal-type domain-containing protein n=1 Tax=Asterophora parasitica TaxID=117018 RepID=A0A9P7G8E5_9AGAR|nr:hypothetical protein DXG03_007615 [Asterophora parasitica]
MDTLTGRSFDTNGTPSVTGTGDHNSVLPTYHTSLYDGSQAWHYHQGEHELVSMDLSLLLHNATQSFAPAPHGSSTIFESSIRDEQDVMAMYRTWSTSFRQPVEAEASNNRQPNDVHERCNFSQGMFYPPPRLTLGNVEGQSVNGFPVCDDFREQGGYLGLEGMSESMVASHPMNGLDSTAIDAGEENLWMLLNSECYDTRYLPETEPAPARVEHTPILPHQLSSYSELSANVEFLNSLMRQPHGDAESETCIDAPAAPFSQDHTYESGLEAEEYPSQGQALPPSYFESQFQATLGSLETSQPPSGRRRRRPNIPPPGANDESSESWRFLFDHRMVAAPASSSASHGLSPLAHSSSSTSSTYSPSSSSSIFSCNDLVTHPSQMLPSTARRGSPSQPAKVSNVACYYCRERKIACGRAAIGSLDQRCNQCQRRNFQCVYPKHNKRGQHRRKGFNKSKGKDRSQ